MRSWVILKKASQWLEPYAGKLARTVLRRVAISNNRYLSDYKELQNQDVQKALAEIISMEEWESLRKSTSTAYYTPVPIIRYCWQIVEQLGFTSGDILEPTCGVGSFFEYMPEAIRKRSNITGIELEKELKKQIKINHNLKALVFQIKDISANFDSLYNSIMDDTQALGCSIQRVENELKELEDKTA